MANQPKITGIHHVALKCQGVEHFEKTVHFYHEILGLSLLRSWGKEEKAAVMLDTGAGILEIFANGTDRLGAGALRHIALAVEDTDVCVEAVRAAGYEITQEPNDIVIPSNPKCPARIAFCIGPVGEELEFFCEK